MVFRPLLFLLVILVSAFAAPAAVRQDRENIQLGPNWVRDAQLKPKDFARREKALTEALDVIRRDGAVFAGNPDLTSHQVEVFRSILAAIEDDRVLFEADCAIPGAMASVLTHEFFGERVVVMRFASRFHKWRQSTLLDVLWHELVHVRDALRALDNDLSISSYETEFNAFEVTSWIWETRKKTRGFPGYKPLFRKSWLELPVADREVERRAAISAFMDRHPFYSASRDLLFTNFSFRPRTTVTYTNAETK